MDELVSLYPSIQKWKFWAAIGCSGSYYLPSVYFFNLYCSVLSMYSTYIGKQRIKKKCTAQKYVFLKRKQFLKNNCFKTIKNCWPYQFINIWKKNLFNLTSFDNLKKKKQLILIKHLCLESWKTSEMLCLVKITTDEWWIDTQTK